jgi:hypothetical protein
LKQKLCQATHERDELQQQNQESKRILELYQGRIKDLQDQPLEKYFQLKQKDRKVEEKTAVSKAAQTDNTIA